MKRITALSVLIGAIALAGCGGGSGGGTATGGRAALLITDSFREDFDHVWATIYKVELIPASGAPVVLFDDPTGRSMDLKTLRDASGARYALLGAASVPAGSYVGVRITLGADMQLFEHGHAVGAPKPIADTFPKDANGHPQVSLTFPTPKTLGAGGEEVVVDFDLARFVLSGGKVTPALAEGDKSGLGDANRHEREDYHGTVSGLAGAAPDRTFTLNRGRGMTLNVVTTASTAIFGAASLTDGVVVEVKGAYNPATDRVVATRIEVRPAGDRHDEHSGTQSPELEGAASAIDPTTGAFTVTVHDAQGFAPGQTTVNVVVSDSTSFLTDGGRTQTRAGFFTALAKTLSVEVEGSYDAATNTLTATRAKIEDHTRDGGWENEVHQDRDGGNGDGGNGGGGKDDGPGHH